MNALNAIALARCERNLSTLTPSNLPRLEHFKIEWGLGGWISAGKAQVYALVSLSECGLDMKVLEMLRECAEKYSKARLSREI